MKRITASVSMTFVMSDDIFAKQFGDLPREDVIRQFKTVFTESGMDMGEGIAARAECVFCEIEDVK